MNERPNQPPSPEAILQIGLGFWPAKVLLTAVELGLFTELAANGPQDAEALRSRFGLDGRGVRDFLDALVALRMLDRTDGRYSNTPSADLFLDRAKPSYVGGLLEMANARLYAPWGRLGEALRTGEQQNEAQGHGGESPFEVLYADPDRLRQFLSAMTGISLGTGRALAAQFPWGSYRTVIDIGAAQGAVPVQVALAHPHLTGGGFDLPPVRPIFEEYVAAHGLADRLRFYPGNFFEESLPSADVLVMGHILHDWSLDQKRMLLRKAYEALPEGGALIVYEALIDDERRENAFGLMMSLNMLIETPAGFDFTGADCVGWMREAGFREASVTPLNGANGMVVGVK